MRQDWPLPPRPLRPISSEQWGAQAPSRASVSAPVTETGDDGFDEGVETATQARVLPFLERAPDAIASPTLFIRGGDSAERRKFWREAFCRKPLRRPAGWWPCASASQAKRGILVPTQSMPGSSKEERATRATGHFSSRMTAVTARKYDTERSARFR